MQDRDCAFIRAVCDVNQLDDEGDEASGEATQTHENAVCAPVTYFILHPLTARPGDGSLSISR